MATARRLSAALATCRSAFRSKALSPSAPLLRPPPASSRFPRFPLFNRVTENDGYSNASGGFASSMSQTYIPAMIAGFFGFGFVGVAYADGAAEDSSKSSLPLPPQSSPIPSHSDLQETAKEVRAQIEELIKSKGMAYGSYPRFTVSVKGQKVTVRFQVLAESEIPLLIANLASNLGVKDVSGSGADMMLRAWHSGVAWQLSLGFPKTDQDQSHIQTKEISKEDISVLISRPLIGSNNKAEIEFTKEGMFTPDELEAMASVLQVAGQQKTLEGRPRSNVSQSIDKTVSSLEAMGVRIFGLSEPNSDPSKYDISWDNIAGYDKQKREIEDTVLLALQRPEVYDDIARGTRCKFESNRPKAVLFEGPPGTGKTSCARVIANQAGVPLMHVPLEVIMSKYFGESERLLGKVFTLANELPNGAIIFLDEVDSFAVARDGETHEATRRVLSVLLRQIDGFEQDKKVVVVAATNRKEDLDPALISRFDCMIYFGLPDEKTRCEIAAQYAKHLTKDQLAEFAKITQNMSGRDIRDVCQQAERRWASKIIRGKTKRNDSEENQLLPPFEEYMTSAIRRGRALKRSDEGKKQRPNRVGRNNRFDYV